MTLHYSYYTIWWYKEKSVYTVHSSSYACTFCVVVGALLLSLLQPCSIASLHPFHTSSYMCRQFQYCWYCSSTIFFSSYSSLRGRPGYSLVPPGVHLAITSAPKIASFASLMESIRTLCIVAPFLIRCGYFSSTSWTLLSLSFFISDDGRALSPAEREIGSGSGHTS